jgi:hypothetical protein
MEPEESLACSPKPYTDPYPEPDQSNLYHSVPSLRSILILSPHLRLGLPSGLLTLSWGNFYKQFKMNQLDVSLVFVPPWLHYQNLVYQGVMFYYVAVQPHRSAGMFCALN